MLPPLILTEIRHGQSQGNVINKKPGTFPENYVNFPSNLYELTRLGIKQSQIAGQWVIENIEHIDAIYTSPSPRVLQTLEHSNILTNYGPICYPPDLRLIEQYWGAMDNTPYEERLKHLIAFAKKGYDELTFCPPGGETMAACQLRIHDFHNMLCRQHSGQNIVVFTHGGIMEAHAVDILRMNGLDYQHASTHKTKPCYVRNCQITQYTRQNPENDEVSDEYTFFRSVCPWDNDDQAIWEPIQKSMLDQQSLSALNHRTRDEQINRALLELGVDTEYLQNL